MAAVYLRLALIRVALASGDLKTWSGFERPFCIRINLSVEKNTWFSFVLSWGELGQVPERLTARPISSYFRHVCAILPERFRHHPTCSSQAPLVPTYPNDVPGFGQEGRKPPPPALLPLDRWFVLKLNLVLPLKRATSPSWVLTGMWGVPRLICIRSPSWSLPTAAYGDGIPVPILRPSPRNALVSSTGHDFSVCYSPGLYIPFRDVRIGRRLGHVRAQLQGRRPEGSICPVPRFRTVIPPNTF